MRELGEQELLDRVRKRGWDDHCRKEFLSRYGSLIRRNILYHIRRCYGGSQLHALSQHLATLQEGRASGAQGGIKGDILTIAVDTWQDVMVEVWKPGDNLIQRWYKYKAQREEAGEQFRELETYLKGSVHNIFWGHLRREKGKKEVPMDIEQVEGRQEERAKFANEIPIEDELCLYWDQLLRCWLPRPQEAEQELVRIKQEASTVLIWACAALKKELQERGKVGALENLKAFMVFYCSQMGPRREQNDLPSPGEVCLERVAGRYLRWEEDVCRKIFHKRMRKDRIMNQLQTIILGSPYRDMVQ